MANYGGLEPVWVNTRGVTRVTRPFSFFVIQEASNLV